MSRFALNFAAAAAALATTLSAAAAPVALNFKATITSHDNFQSSLSQYLGQQVTGTIWLESNLQTPTYEYSDGWGSTKQWYGQQGCNIASNGACQHEAYTVGALAVVGYELSLPFGLAQENSMMNSPLFRSNSGVNKQVWSNWEHQNYWYHSYVQNGNWGAENLSFEAQNLSLSLSGNDVFAEIGNPYELLNQAGTLYKSLNFSYYKQTCHPSEYGYDCSYYSPNSINLNMSLDSLSAQDVPEPASIGLLGLGLAAIAVLRRRASK